MARRSCVTFSLALLDTRWLTGNQYSDILSCFFNLLYVSLLLGFFVTFLRRGVSSRSHCFRFYTWIAIHIMVWPRKKVLPAFLRIPSDSFAASFNSPSYMYGKTLAQSLWGGDCASLNITNLWQKFMPGTEPPKELQSQYCVRMRERVRGKERTWCCEFGGRHCSLHLIDFHDKNFFEVGTEQRVERCCLGIESRFMSAPQWTSFCPADVLPFCV